MSTNTRIRRLRYGKNKYTSNENQHKIYFYVSINLFIYRFQNSIVLKICIKYLLSKNLLCVLLYSMSMFNFLFCFGNSTTESLHPAKFLFTQNENERSFQRTIGICCVNQFSCTFMFILFWLVFRMRDSFVMFHVHCSKVRSNNLFFWWYQFYYWCALTHRIQLKNSNKPKIRCTSRIWTQLVYVNV